MDDADREPSPSDAFDPELVRRTERLPDGRYVVFYETTEAMR